MIFWHVAINIGMVAGILPVVGVTLPLISYGGSAMLTTAAALGLVIGGALGNVVDRIRFGAVADFLDFHGLWFPWVFNVADAAITVGAILLAVDMVFFTETEPGKGTTWAQLRARFAGRANR
jgi:lipoprotein signal peptidase